jgi:hypothetical protein
MPRKKEQSEFEKQTAPDAKARVKGNDALVTVTVETVTGAVSRTYRVAGYMGNTLAWQRSGKGMDDTIIPGLVKAFGGQVTEE